MVVEAVFESLEVKRQIFAQLEAICPASTILCSNTSALDIDQIAAAASSRPHVVMGTLSLALSLTLSLTLSLSLSLTLTLTLTLTMGVGEPTLRACEVELDVRIPS